MLHQVIAIHLKAFLGAAAEAGDGAGLPQFVEREFPEVLTGPRTLPPEEERGAMVSANGG